jgi:ribose transport system ATP-binding protein
VLRAIVGEQPLTGGRITLEGSDLLFKLNVHRAASLGIAFVTDRLEAGVPSFSVRENLSLGSMEGLTSHGSVRRREERASARSLVEECSVRPSNVEIPLANLSGGNQQKVVLGRSLRILPKVLLLENAMRGVDVGAKAVLYGVIQRAARRGVGVLMTSTDFEELCGLCQRVVVMRDGVTVGEVVGDALTPSELLRSCYS